MTPLDSTHAADLTSWVESANDPDNDFPLQNLPFGRFRADATDTLRIGVAIGDAIVDLERAGLVTNTDMNALMEGGTSSRIAMRRALSNSLRNGSDARATFERALVPQSGVEVALPCRIGDYTDFYASVHHATNVGRQFRPDNPLLPNYKWVPIGYHGRASSIRPSGHSFARPNGQTKPADSDVPTLSPSRRLDYELEMGAIVARSNALGESVSIAQAEDHVFGLVLLNDWSARDIQAWEYQPLGPFLSKSFATTVSPWIVTLEALAPFRVPFSRAGDDPAPLPYLESTRNRESGAFDVKLEVWLQTQRMKSQRHAGEKLAASNLKDAYWTIAQLVAHHTINGCNLQSGDLLGTGTLSGPSASEVGSLLELSKGGKETIRLGNGETRTFLEDGDTVILRGHCEREGFRRIGFGECRATVLPARGVARSS
ncbi:MAG TPA: fumarylacetoacetase [Casimicrobiaceae bacterium]|nr:fumarylacetoacetase [Casimicrobiaceae bacterium]